MTVGTTFQPSLITIPSKSVLHTIKDRLVRGARLHYSAPSWFFLSRNTCYRSRVFKISVTQGHINGLITCVNIFVVEGCLKLADVRIDRRNNPRHVMSSNEPFGIEFAVERLDKPQAFFRLFMGCSDLVGYSLIQKAHPLIRCPKEKRKEKKRGELSHLK